MNQFSALSHFLPRQLLTITRESILSCPALSTMFPGRLARLATGADSNLTTTISLRRLYCDSIMHGGGAAARSLKREVDEKRREYEEEKLVTAG